MPRVSSSVKQMNQVQVLKELYAIFGLLGFGRNKLRQSSSLPSEPLVCSSSCRVSNNVTNSDKQTTLDANDNIAHWSG